MSSSNTSERSDATIYESALDNSTLSSFNSLDMENNTTLTNDDELSNANLDQTYLSSSDDNNSSLCLIESFADDDNMALSLRNKNKRKRSIDEVILISSEDEAELSDITPVTVGTSGTLSADKTTDYKDLSNDTSMLSKSSSIQEFKIYKSLHEFDQNLPSTVTLLTTPFGSKVYLVGTAHFSEESQNDVSLVIRNVQPQIVMVELCNSRIHILKHDEKTLLEEAKDINIAKIRNIIQTNGVINGVFFILLLNISAKLTKQLGMAPGGEFRRAVEEANRLPNCMLHLGDRPINITLQRALHGLSFWQTLKLVWRLITSDDNISKEEVEQCKQSDLLEKLMQEMAGEFPAFGNVFVKERDLYLCHSLQLAALPHPQPDGTAIPINVVGVVGIGHAAGIAEHWGKVDLKKIPEILIIPPASLSNRIFKKTIKYGFLGLCAFGIYKIVRPRLSSIL